VVFSELHDQLASLEKHAYSWRAASLR